MVFAHQDDDDLSEIPQFSSALPLEFQRELGRLLNGHDGSHVEKYLLAREMVQIFTNYNNRLVD